MTGISCVHKITDRLVESARESAAKLNKDDYYNGQLLLPQQLASVECVDDDDRVYFLTIGLESTRSCLFPGADMFFYVYHNNMFVMDSYRYSIRFTHFDDPECYDAFRQETEKLVARVVDNGFKTVKKRIEDNGISACDHFLVPEKTQNLVMRLSDNCTLSVLEHSFEGVNGIKDYIRKQTDDSQPYILDCCERFPCFDAEDYASEYWFYRNYLFCWNKQEADMKAEQMKQLDSYSDYCMVNNNLPDEMRPMVYYKDESSMLLLAC